MITWIHKDSVAKGTVCERAVAGSHEKYFPNVVRSTFSSPFLNSQRPNQLWKRIATLVVPDRCKGLIACGELTSELECGELGFDGLSVKKA